MKTGSPKGAALLDLFWRLPAACVDERRSL
jgi:hypothetical protein